MRPTSLADALIRAKAKLASFASGERKRTFLPSNQGPFRPQKIAYPIHIERKPPMNPAPDHRTGTFVAPRPNPPAPKLPVQPSRVNAIPVTQTGRGIQCFNCKQWGHRRTDCPSKGPRRGRPRNTLPPRERAFTDQHENPNPRENLGPAQPTMINYVSISDEAEEQAEVYATQGLSKRNRQYPILEDQEDYEGKPLTF